MLRLIAVQCCKNVNIKFDRYRNKRRQKHILEHDSSINLIYFFYLAGTDLPDDDYTTVVPAIKQPNGTNRKLPNVPSIIENKENDSLSSFGKGLFV